MVIKDLDIKYFRSVFPKRYALGYGELFENYRWNNILI